MFADASAADRALADLTRQDRRAYEHLLVAPFGRLGHDPDGDTTILAGRLADESVPDAALIIEARGGLLISDIDARRTGWKDEGLDPLAD